MKNQKTVIYISTNTKKDGAEESLVSLQRNMISNHNLNTLTIIPRHGLIEDILKEAGIPYWIYRFEGNVNYNRGTKLLRGCVKAMINRHAAKALSKRIKKQKINAVGVHSNTITSEMGAYLASDLKVPHIWHVREFGKLDFGFDFELGFKYIKKCAVKAKKVVCNSKAVMDYYAQYLNNDNLTYIYNGVKFEKNGERQWDDGVFRMILIGRLSDEKGQAIAIEACKKLFADGCTNFELDLYGDGVNRKKYQAMIDEYCLAKHIHLMGYSNTIPIAQYHAGLMCSHHEAFGRVTVEYMVNELPVIGIASGGTAEIIEDGVTGYLIQSGDADELSAKIRKLYLDRKKCIEMGTRGRERAEKMFTEQTYCDAIFRLYEQCFGIGE